MTYLRNIIADITEKIEYHEKEEAFCKRRIAEYNKNANFHREVISKLKELRGILISFEKENTRRTQ